MKETKVELFIFRFFTVIGLFFFIIGAFLCYGAFNLEDKIYTTGVISEIITKNGIDGDEHLVYVTYEVDDKTYNTQLNFYSTNFYEGKEIDIYYMSGKPMEIGVKGFEYFVLIFPGMGLLFMIIGSIGLIFISKNKKIFESLKSNGEVVYANYLETTLNTSYSVNGRNPYVILCEWYNSEDSKRYIFKSENIWINLEGIIKEKNITLIPVYINRKNIKKYFVDVSEITSDIIDTR